MQSNGNDVRRSNYVPQKKVVEDWSTNCKVCRKLFKSSHQRTYCSHDCQRIETSLRRGVTRTIKCLTCGKGETINTSGVGKGNGKATKKYCSPACANHSAAKRRRSPERVAICSTCMSTIRTRSANKKYCSVGCRVKASTALRRAETKIGNCKNCGDEFSIIWRRRTHCSVKCQRQWKVRADLKRRKEPDARWKANGSIRISANGYQDIKLSDGVWVSHHRHVMEQHLGRPLQKKETVHHKSGDRSDNRLLNLELWSSAQPGGQRVVDKLVWAQEIIELYGARPLVPRQKAKSPHRSPSPNSRRSRQPVDAVAGGG